MVEKEFLHHAMWQAALKSWHWIRQNVRHIVILHRSLRHFIQIGPPSAEKKFKMAGSRNAFFEKAMYDLL